MHKIYLIEDDEYLSRVYERAFRFAGHDVKVALDGDKARQELTSENSELPDAIVMDIMIPKLNGFELLTILRNDRRFNKVPIVILTNSVHEDESKRFMSAGADLFLVKIENQTKEVVDKVQEAINKGRPDSVHP